MKPQRPGFTLLELLLYVSVASIMLLGIVSFMLVLQTSRVKQTDIAEVEEQGEQVMALITQTLRNADSVTSPSAGASGTSLTIDVLDAAVDPTIFQLTSGQLQIVEGSGATTTNLTSSDVTASALTFTNLARTGTRASIQIEFTLTSNDYAATFSDTATVRPN